MHCRAKIAREARFATQDAKRRKMREELEKRERTVAIARDEEAAARAKLKVRGGLPVPRSAHAWTVQGQRWVARRANCASERHAHEGMFVQHDSNKRTPMRGIASTEWAREDLDLKCRTSRTE